MKLPLSLALLFSQRKLCQGSQGLITDLVGEFLSMQEAEDMHKAWVTNGTLPQQGNLDDELRLE